MSLRGRSLEDIAYEICTAFDAAGIVTVLVGGSAASFYAPAAYMTRDLDFVLHFELFGLPAKGAEVLKELGFKPTKTRGTLEHDEIPFTLEILDGPLSIGGEDLASWDTHRKNEQLLHVISATDCVKDRLAHAIHFKDLSSARQAAEVAKLHPVSFSEIEAWCYTEEGSLKTFQLFQTFL